MARRRTAPAENAQLATQAPADPPPEPDAQLLAHAFEASPPLTLSQWDVGTIRDARDAHLQGHFQASAQLSQGMLVDGRIYAARLQRVAPALGILREVVGGPRWNGKGLTETVRAAVGDMMLRDGPCFAPGVLAETVDTAAVLGEAILQNITTTRPDGSRVDVEVRPWPMTQARWNESKKRHQVFTTEGIIDIEPNDGKWIVVQPYGPRSFKHGAILPLAMLWADRAYAMRDRGNHSAAHGSINIVGTLPEGVKPQSKDGIAFRDGIRLLQQARSGIVKQYGSNVEAFEPKTLAWQIFGQIIDGDAADIALILQGILPGGDGPYKSIPQLDGVRYDHVKRDTSALQWSLQMGLVRHYVRWNFGDDPDLVPEHRWIVPDPRELERVDALTNRYKALASIVTSWRAAGLMVTEEMLEALSQRLGLDSVPVPTFAADLPPAPTVSETVAVKG